MAYLKRGSGRSIGLSDDRVLRISGVSFSISRSRNNGSELKRVRLATRKRRKRGREETKESRREQGGEQPPARSPKRKEGSGTAPSARCKREAMVRGSKIDNARRVSVHLRFTGLLVPIYSFFLEAPFFASFSAFFAFFSSARLRRFFSDCRICMMP